jgi:branched-chain amino acid transport system permease protein
MVVSLTGDTLSVLRESPVLAASLGTSVYRAKLTAYAISGIPAAMAGCFFTYLDGFVAPDTFGLKLTIAILAASILGGSTSVYGIFVGAAVLQLGPMGSTSFGKYAFVAYGAFLVVAGVALPMGVAGLARTLVDKLRARRRGQATVQHAARSTAELPELAGKRLTIEGISKSFGGVAALTDVSFSAEPGEVVALIGPNGSGKTTLLNIISGYYRPTAGVVRIGEQKISGLRPHRIARAGVARTFQTPIVPALTVEKAVRAARARKSRVLIVETMLRLPRFTRARRRDAEVVRSVLDAVDLGHLADQPAQSLPLGTRRLLEMARCLASEPAVLLLDEVASGLDDEEVAELSQLIRAIRRQGGTVVLVEHNFALVRALADRVAVLSRGQLVIIETPETVASHPEVLEHYLGQMQPVASTTTEPAP